MILTDFLQNRRAVVCVFLMFLYYSRAMSQLLLFLNAGKGTI